MADTRFGTSPTAPTSPIPTPMSGGKSRWPDPGLIAFYSVLLAYVLWFWIIPLRNSFWLDEALLVSAIRGKTLIENITANYLTATQPMAYGALEWLLSRIGSGEILLRVPSVIASLATLWLCFRIAKDAGGDAYDGAVFQSCFVAI